MVISWDHSSDLKMSVKDGVPQDVLRCLRL